MVKICMKVLEKICFLSSQSTFATYYYWYMYLPLAICVAILLNKPRASLGL